VTAPRARKARPERRAEADAAILAPSDLARRGAGVRDGKHVLVGGRVAGRTGDALVLRDALGDAVVALTDVGGEIADGDLLVVRGVWSRGRVRDAEVRERFPKNTQAPSAEFRRFTENGLGKQLAARASALRAVRDYFDGQDFLEVETPLRVASPGLDANVNAVPAEGGFLITSPELHMKRLVVGGLPRVYQIARTSRAEELGHLHEPEFVMVEWYRAFSGMEAVVNDAETLVSRVVQGLSGTLTARTPSGLRVDVTPPFRRLTVRDAFRKYAGVSDAADLAATDPDAYFQTFVDRVEPALAKRRHALVLTEFPATEAALARPCPHDASVAERFEIYVGGVELCNGFGELTDAVEQRKRFISEQERRRKTGDPVYPLDENFLAALEEGLPPSGGNALGFDRLVMVALGVSAIAGVMAFPRGG
jgi:lysyl-tRNA synthetase class 2